MRRRVLWAGLLYLAVVAAGVGWYVLHFGPTSSVLGSAVGALVALLGLPAALRGVLLRGKAGSAPLPLETVADGLARSVRMQWEAEVKLRRLDDPYRLPISWTTADDDLVEPWPLLRDMAENWPGNLPSDRASWAAGPEELVGQGGDIGQIFRQRVPTRRLVVLGEPGAGKTMLLVRLIQDLLKHRSAGAPVPVLFPLASWDPARRPLYDWLADQLVRDFPALHNPAPVDPAQTSPDTQARALLDQQMILPILDGLDELAPALRTPALEAVNGDLPADQPLVLSSHTEEYRDAVTSPAPATARLNGAAGIRLLPLDSTTAVAYLRRAAGETGTEDAARWNGVAACLGTNAPAAQALSTPLGLFLARTIYNRRPGEPHTLLAHPDELVNRTNLPTRQDVEAHLFSAFIPAAYRRYPGRSSRWTAEQAQRTFTFLARHLQHTLNGTPNLAWWELRKALPRYRSALLVALLVAVPIGLMWGLLSGLWYGLIAGPILGATVGTYAYPWDESPSMEIHWTMNRSQLRGELVTLVGVALVIVFGTGFDRRYLSALSISLAIGLMGHLTPVPPDLATTVGPAVVLARDRRTFWTVWLTSGLAVGLALGLLGGPASGLVGLFVFGLAFSSTKSVWLNFMTARLWLAVLGLVPWRLMAFLADAHQRRGVLRQVGAVYQFRHLDLQRHLADQESPDRLRPPKDRH
ncbi:NACHT domain-containing protein [Kitasatospora sp. NPDC004669]|uniref:NACHT domain-containing protein n=1 Tax=Kitasatospora sp. NPDC004669 TaxID=3154555 RepID=UPI0033A16734